jgi:type 1 fimbria pilin
MNASFMNKHTKLAVLSGLLAALFSLSTQAAVYSYTFTDSGQIPQDGTVLAFEHQISGIAEVIQSVELILTFNDSASLTGNSSSGIQGLLNLGITGTSPFVSFSPTATSSSGAERIYDMTFSGTSGTPGTGFLNSNPNDIWGLVLYDNSTSGIENSLISWTLDITAVPEPINVALGLFAALFAGFKLFSWRRQQRA